MRIIEQFLNLFTESEKEIREDIARSERIIHQNKEKMKHMGEQPALKRLFTESKEDLKAQIDEEEAKIQAAKKRITQTKQKQRKNHRLAKGVSRQTKKAAGFLQRHKIGTGLFAAAIILLIIASIFGYRMATAFKFSCDRENPCTECLVAPSCLQIQEDGPEQYAWFSVENRNSIPGDCHATIQLGDTLQEETLGVLYPEEPKVFRFAIDIPSGNSDITVDASCQWFQES
ncbi:MAG: hypothetical protein ACQESG_00100 [Nanobdellota archaeon]